jgi:hypothetical protein
MSDVGCAMSDVAPGTWNPEPGTRNPELITNTLITNNQYTKT